MNQTHHLGKGSFPDGGSMDDSGAIDGLTKQLETDGVVLMPELCSTEFLERVLAVSHQRIGEVQKALGTREIGIGSAAGYEEIVQRSPGRWDVPITPEQFGFDVTTLPWSRLVTAVLGSDAEHSFSGIVFSDPGSAAQCWHTDSLHLAAEHRAAHALNVMVALHDISMPMGPTEFAVGSHVLSNHLSNPSLERDELVYQHASTSPRSLVDNTASPVPESCASDLAAGSCLVFDDRILHRGLANQSDTTRYMAYFSYRCAGYSENTHFESRRSLF